MDINGAVVLITGASSGMGAATARAASAGKEAAAEMVANSGMEVQPPELVAETILDLIKSGAEQADLVPRQFGGTYNP